MFNNLGPHRSLQLASILLAGLTLLLLAKLPSFQISLQSSLPWKWLVLLSLLQLGLLLLNLLFTGRQKPMPKTAGPMPKQGERHQQACEPFQIMALQQAIGEVKEAAAQIEKLLTGGHFRSLPEDATLASSLPKLSSSPVPLAFFPTAELTLAKEKTSEVYKQLIAMRQQVQEHAHRSNTNRVEWNQLSSQLRFTKHQQSLFNKDFSRVQLACSQEVKVIRDALKLEADLYTKINKMKQQLQSFSEYAQNGEKQLNNMHEQISCSQEDVNLASDLVQLLSDRAKEIVHIIDVIDDIAEQTNLLALNASIEAARAGEQGQGFAVVAEEVRKLAVRSSTATSSITDLLLTIQNEAETASSRLNKSKETVSQASSSIAQFVKTYKKAIFDNRLSYVTLNEHFQQLAKLISFLLEAQKANNELEKDGQKLLQTCQDILTFISQILNQVSSLSLDSDRLTRFLSRQTISLQHWEYLLQAGQDHLEQSSGQLLARSDAARSGSQTEPRSPTEQADREGTKLRADTYTSLLLLRNAEEILGELIHSFAPPTGAARETLNSQRSMKNKSTRTDEEKQQLTPMKASQMSGDEMPHQDAS